MASSTAYVRSGSNTLYFTSILLGAEDHQLLGGNSPEHRNATAVSQEKQTSSGPPASEDAPDPVSSSQGFFHPGHSRQEVVSFSVPNTPTEAYTPSAKFLDCATAPDGPVTFVFTNRVDKSPDEPIEQSVPQSKTQSLLVPDTRHDESWLADLRDSLPIPELPRRLRLPIQLSLPDLAIPSSAFSTSDSPVANGFLTMPFDRRFTSSSHVQSHRRHQSEFSTLGQSRPSQPLFTQSHDSSDSPDLSSIKTGHRKGLSLTTQDAYRNRGIEVTK